MHGRTPQERIERAVRKEIEDLCVRADGALKALSGDDSSNLLQRARDVIRGARLEGTFPRAGLGALLHEASPKLKAELESWIERHRSLEQRLRWLLDPSLTRAELTELDPVSDADQIWCFVQFEFRPEFLHSAWGNATKRIVQMESATAFLHATGRAEAMPILRADETLCFFHYFFEWGQDSYHGRKSIESINRIHGRYALPNDAMKYVLLNSAFTVLDGLDAIGHRPLREVERLGYFNAYVNMGKAMGIQELSRSFYGMQDWFRQRCRAWSGYSPRKLRMWESIHDSFDRALGIPPLLGKLRRLPEVLGMDASYRAALGFSPPPPRQIAVLRGLMKLVARARAALPCEPWILSLQDFYSFPNGVDVEALGPKARSERLPATACPFSGAESLPSFSWEEVSKHDRADDLWLVFGGHVYDVSSFAKNHPGGLEVLLEGSGQDLTLAFEKAGHGQLTRVFTQNFRIGTIAPDGAHASTPARGGKSLSQAPEASADPGLRPS